jgi:flagellar basal body-associated protein FliL
METANLDQQQPATQSPLEQKKGHFWLWFVITIVLLAIAATVYLLMRPEDNQSPSPLNNVAEVNNAQNVAPAVEAVTPTNPVTDQMLLNGTFASEQAGVTLTFKDGETSYLCAIYSDAVKDTCTARISSSLVADINGDGINDGIVVIRENWGGGNADTAASVSVVLGTKTGTPTPVKQAGIPYKDITQAANNYIPGVESITFEDGNVVFVVVYGLADEGHTGDGGRDVLRYHWNGQSLIKT